MIDLSEARRVGGLRVRQFTFYNNVERRVARYTEGKSLLSIIQIISNDSTEVMEKNYISSQPLYTT